MYKNKQSIIQKKLSTNTRKGPCKQAKVSKGATTKTKVKKKNKNENEKKSQRAKSLLFEHC